MPEDIYAVIGNPISHSKSPQIHTHFAKQTQQSLKYIAIEAPLAKFSETVKDFFTQGGKGCNVTLPFKEQAWQLVNNRSQQAEIAGAVNTIKLMPDNTLLGDNTDGVGFIRDLQNNLNYKLANKKILIIGAGGAIRGILKPLFDTKPQIILIANRTAAKAITLAEQFDKFGNIQGIGLTELPKQSFDLIINGTSAQAKGENFHLPEYILAEQSYCYDLMYSSSLTSFLQWAKNLGVKHYSDGLGMLVEQAAEAFYLWRGVLPNTQSIIKQLQIIQ